MAQMTQNASFGLVFMFSALPSLSCIPQQYTADYNCKTQVSNKKKRNNNKKNLLFGPFSSSLLSLSCIPQYTAYYNCKTQVSNKKNEIIIIKTHFWPKRRVRRRLGPFSSPLASMCPPIRVQHKQNLYTVGQYKKN